MKRSDLFTGKYLFHMHTTYADGKLTIEDYFQFARETSIERLLFLEHVRREPSYDCGAFAAEINEAAKRYRVEAHAGFEAKILPSGLLDITDEQFAISEIVGIAEHGFPDGIDALAGSLRRAFKRYRDLAPSKELVWVHPGTGFRKSGTEPEHHTEYVALLEDAVRSGIRLENNLHYGLVSASVATRLTGASVVVGANAHSIEDLARWSEGFVSVTASAP